MASTVSHVLLFPVPRNPGAYAYTHHVSGRIYMNQMQRFSKILPSELIYTWQEMPHALPPNTILLGSIGPQKRPASWRQGEDEATGRQAHWIWRGIRIC